MRIPALHPALLVGGVLAVGAIGIVASFTAGLRVQLQSRARSPVGVWVARVGASRVTLEINGGPHEGLYKQVITGSDPVAAVEEREIGRWTARGGILRLITMATDRPRHPRVGIEALYQLGYGQVEGRETLTLRGPPRTPREVGPDAPAANLTFTRSSAGALPAAR